MTTPADHDAAQRDAAFRAGLEGLRALLPKAREVLLAELARHPGKRGLKTLLARAERLEKLQRDAHAQG